ncbi:MAG: hypothetical protein QOH51_1001 [Acidobacteriota bacterium]|jgi:glycosyltransferase involved in cell wall biosynthesis|nr:hypothetical protein [Acidobacteriota bacterium]
MADQSDTTSRPLVSVVMPTYNYAGFIAETLERLCEQTHENWECVVVDDGSTDDTAEVLARFTQREPRIRYLRQANQRQAVAKNTGLADARGKYVQFLDADDFIGPRKFELQVAYLESHPEVDIVYGGVRYFKTERPDELLPSMFGEQVSWMPEASGAGRELLRLLMVDNIMVINAPLVRRTAIDDVGWFDAMLPPVEDWDYWIRCALQNKRFEFRDFDGTLALVRSHPASSSKQSSAMLASHRRLRRKIDALVEDAELLRLHREVWSQSEAELGVQRVGAGRRSDAARQFLSAARLCPRAKGRTKLLLCALASAFADEPLIRGLMKWPTALSPTR